MLDAQGVQTFFDQIHNLWIQPEIEARKAQGRLPADFKIYQALIKLPRTSGPVVEFNQEIHWQARAKVAGGGEFRPGHPVYLHEVEAIETVEPPEVEGERAAFLYLFWAGTSYQIIFDFTPNDPRPRQAEFDAKNWEIGKNVADALQAVLTERAIQVHDSVQQLLSQIGLWAVPSLLPYPISKIAVHLGQGDPADARKLLVDHCKPAFLTGLTDKWWTQPHFNTRKALLIEALDAHSNGKYHLSIHTLLPHLEGIITDWIYTKVPAGEVPWRQESKTKKFRDVIAAGPPSTYTYQRIVASTLDFILSGPVLSTFKGWFDSIDNSFANRNVVEHGKYDSTLFSEEASIKVSLLLDTVFHILSKQ